MLTTIFTGHAVDLTDIVAISPVEYQNKPLSAKSYMRGLTLTISCKFGVVIFYDHLVQTVSAEQPGLPGQTTPWVLDESGNAPTNAQNDEWKAADADLVQKRQALIEQVDQARLTQPQPGYACLYPQTPERITTAFVNEEGGADRQH